jgi:hypothetical protein
VIVDCFYISHDVIWAATFPWKYRSSSLQQFFCFSDLHKYSGYKFRFLQTISPRIFWVNKRWGVGLYSWISGCLSTQYSPSNSMKRLDGLLESCGRSWWILDTRWKISNWHNTSGRVCLCFFLDLRKTSSLGLFRNAFKRLGVAPFQSQIFLIWSHRQCTPHPLKQSAKSIYKFQCILQIMKSWIPTGKTVGKCTLVVTWLHVRCAHRPGADCQPRQRL